MADPGTRDRRSFGGFVLVCALIAARSAHAQDEIAFPAATPPPRVVAGPFETIRESVFGPAPRDDWRPLPLRTFFSEGWDEPFRNAPEGTNGAPKQLWLGAPVGIFARLASVDFMNTFDRRDVPGLFLAPASSLTPIHTRSDGNQYGGFATFFLPLSARMELVVGSNFVDSRKSGPSGRYTGNVGDTAVQASFRLIEDRDFSLVANLAERIPTGKPVNGGGVNYVTPGAEFWWNFAPKWVVRGGTAISVPTARRSPATVLINQLSIGRYLTGRDAAFFKELELHATANVLSDVSSGSIDDVYLFPGFRFGVDDHQTWYLLGGVQVPVSGPRPYGWQLQFAITRNF